MEQGYIFIIMLLGIGLISALLFWHHGRKKGVSPDVLRALLFFFCAYYFLVSGAKVLLGEPESTLIESLWDTDHRTFIHYGIPLSVGGAILPFFMHWLLKKKAVRYIDLFDAGIIIGLLAASVVCGGPVSNGVFIVLFAGCAVLSMILASIYKKELSYPAKGEAVGMLPQISLSVVMLLLYFPGELCLGNLEEFPCTFWEFFVLLLLGAAICAAIVVFAWLSFLPRGVSRFLSMLLFGLLVMGYIQALFLNGKLGIMDGGEQVWGTARQIGNIVLWIVLVGILVVLGYRKKAAERVYRAACIYICLIQAVSLAYMIFTTDLTGQKQGAELTTQGSLELSAKDNVVVFVLDRFESEILEEIMATDAAFLEPLSDFTFYDNATSQFSMTRSSIPHLLTGVAWNGEVPEVYAEYAYEKSGALPAMAQDGYDIGIYTAIRYYTPLRYDLTSNYKEDVEKHCSLGTTLSTMYRTSMYKIMPFALKGRYAYYSADINSIATSEEIWDIENDLPFYHSLIQKGLTIDQDLDKVFRFYHMMGSHVPYYLSEDMEYDRTGRRVTELSQSKASLKIVYEYMRQMRELGVYDDATIVIIADHGQRLEHAALVDGRPVQTSRPILLIKGAGASQEAMAVNSAPVCQEELMPSLLQAMGLDWRPSGRTLDEVDPDEMRERTYVDFDLIERYLIEYAVNGDARVLEDWDVKRGAYY